MKYVEALDEPAEPFNHPLIFMAGGITNCPDWQQGLRGLLSDVNGGTLLNPRRANFPIDDPNAAQEQIAWEHRWLGLADLVSFWFCKATLCPIVLFELGTRMRHAHPIVIGIEPGYEREQDIRIQVPLYLPRYDDKVQIKSSLSDLATSISNWIRQRQMAIEGWGINTQLNVSNC